MTTLTEKAPVSLKPITAKPLAVFGKKSKIVALPEYNIARFTADEPLFRKSLANLMFSGGWDADSIIGVRKIINTAEAQTVTELLQNYRDKLSSYGEPKTVLYTFTKGDGDDKVSVKLTLAMLIAEFDITYNVVNGVVQPLGDDVLIVFKGFQRSLSLIAANAAGRQVGQVISHVLGNIYDYNAIALEQYPDLEGAELESKAIELYKLECGRENFVKNEGTTRIRGIDHFANGMDIFKTHGRIDGFQAKCRKVMGASAGQKVAALKRLCIDYALDWKELLGRSLESEILSVDSKVKYDALDGMELLNLANKYKTIGKATQPIEVNFDIVKAYILGEVKATPKYTIGTVVDRLKTSTSPALKAIAAILADGETEENNRKLTALLMMEELVTRDIESRTNEILNG